MKRLVAILAFIAGGLAAELAHPLQCSMAPASGVLRRRNGTRTRTRTRNGTTNRTV